MQYIIERQSKEDIEQFSFERVFSPFPPYHKEFLSPSISSLDFYILCVPLIYPSEQLRRPKIIPQYIFLFPQTSPFFFHFCPFSSWSLFSADEEEEEHCLADPVTSHFAEAFDLEKVLMTLLPTLAEPYSPGT